MSDVVIKAENISKLYNLGEIGTGTLSHDLNRWMARLRGLEDPFLKIGQKNDRTKKGSSDFVWALKDINFEVKQGEVLGIIGRNGAGKSTLLKILSKVTTPTYGKIKVKGRIASLLEVGTGFHPELTGRENIFLNGAILGMTKFEIKRKFCEIVDFSGVERYIDTPVKRYSSGMYVRLAFAVAAFLEPEILIVDEVLAVGDSEFQKKCLGRMKDISGIGGRTVLFVSHQLSVIRNLCERSILIDNGTISLHDQTENVIKQYNQIETTNKRHFNKAIIWAEICQVGDHLTVECNYDTNLELDIPHFGFVLYDIMGNPLFGTNPTIDKIKYSSNLSSKSEGKVKVIIRNPKLIDGEYYVSLWFGDSKENIFFEKNALSISINSMTDQNQHDSRSVGSVLPDCIWEFS